MLAKWYAYRLKINNPIHAPSPAMKSLGGKHEPTTANPLYHYVEEDLNSELLILHIISLVVGPISLGY